MLTSREGETTVTLIRPPEGWITLGLRRVYEQAALIYFLAWRDIKVRYRQTVIGVSWAVLQPFLTMVVFSVLFGRLAGVSSDGHPYPIFAFSALVPWTYFTHALTKASSSVVMHRAVITHVYFPRLVLPIAAVSGGLMDFVIAFAILLAMMAAYGVVPTAALLALPFFIALMVATALGMGLWLAALNVQYRDISNAMPFVLQLWLFVTPVAYPSSMIPEAWRSVYGLNPMAGVTEGFRWALLGSPQMSWQLIGASTLAASVLLVSGLYFFRSREDAFADVV